MPEGFDQLQLSEIGVIYTKLLTINNIAASMYNGDLTNARYTAGVDNYYQSVADFQALIARYIDGDFRRQFKELTKRYQEKWLVYKTANPDLTGKNDLSQMAATYSLQYTRARMGLILKLLDRQGVFEQAPLEAFQGLPSEHKTGNTDIVRL